MKKIAITLLATTMLGTPAAFAASNNPQQPAPGQMQQNQGQTGQNAQNQQNQPGGQQQSAENSRPISPHSLSRSEVRQVQQALAKQGMKAGPTDGRWGRETRNAVKQFQQSKQLHPTGQLDEQTVASLGLDTAKFSQSQNQQR